MMQATGWALGGVSLGADKALVGGWPSPGAKESSEETSRTLSHRGKFLHWSPEEEQYWFFTVCDGLDRFERLAFLNRKQCTFEEIARSARGLPVYAFHVGRGPKPIAILSGMHGCEPSGPRGLLAYLDALLGEAAPFGSRVDRSQILKAITLHVIPLLNPGGAQRFAEHFPDSWHGTWIPEWTAENKERFFAEANEPQHYFYGTYVKKAPMHFTPDQIARWEATGNQLGSSLTDDGLDMWFDWGHTYGRETKAVKDLLERLRPYCVTDFHNFMYPTEIFAPTAYSIGSLASEEKDLALAIQTSWRAQKLPFHERSPRPYPQPTEKHYEDYWLHELGARTLIMECNGGMLANEGAEYEPRPDQRALTRRESLASVYFAAQALIHTLAASPA